MSTPMAVGAPSPLSPPGRTERATTHSSDRELLDAVRNGDLHAYGALYERHVDAVRRLARRLCNNRSDVDDVVAEVFANSLRAIKAGRGPSDDLRSYALTSARNTAAKLHTRSDSAHTTPTANDDLDGADDSDPYHVADSIGHAFVQLPDRFQNVLWLNCVEGMAPHEIGERTRMKAGAVTSLCLRARRALAREYLLSRVQRPVVDHECQPVRDLMPSMLHGDAAESSVMRVRSHIAKCDECAQCHSEMEALAGSLRSLPWPAAILAWLRSMLLQTTAPLADSARAVAVGAAVLGTVAAMAVTTGDGPIDASARVDAEIAVSVDGGDSPHSVPGAAGDEDIATGRPPVPPPHDDDDAASPDTAPVTPVAEPIATVTGPVTDVIDRVDNPLGEIAAPPVDIVGPITTVVVDAVVEPITTPIVETLTDEALTPLGQHVLDPVVANAVAPVQQAVAPITDPVVETLQPVVDPVVDDVLAPVVDVVMAPLSPILQPVTAAATAPLQPVADGDGATSGLVGNVIDLFG